MKRLLFVFLSLLMISSCLDDGSGGRSTYTLTATFQFPTDFGADSVYYSTKTPEGFAFDALNFYHKFDSDQVWFDGGFILSKYQMPESQKTAGLNNIYRLYLNEKVNKNQAGNIYTVFFQNEDNALMPAHDVKFNRSEVAGCSCEMLGCFVTNTVQVADSIKANFKVGDKMTIKATGYLYGEKTGEAEFTLAEYTAQKDSIVSSWTLFDFKKLGKVEYVDFEVTSTNPAVPANFCMDSMGANITLVY